MVGKSKKKVYVEADYDNIFVVDPNKLMDESGKVEERLVDHEELVVYANLEARIIPRTKLANGTTFDQAVQNIRVATINGEDSFNINFLKPKGKDYLDTSWSDQITGKGSTEGIGSNQSQFSEVGEGTTKRRVKKILNVEDTQLLGITKIQIKNQLSFRPEVSIQMVDIQGRLLFEQGENSPYSCFVQMPYPEFVLTLKGYFGKAVKYYLMMNSFNAQFDPSSGNYIIDLQMMSKTYALFNDIKLDFLYTLPKFNPSKIQTITKTSSNNQSNLTDVSSRTTSKGFEKLNEVYTAYKSKGLLDEDFPHITVEEMKMKLERYEKYVMESYGKEDLSVLANLDFYDEDLINYKQKIFSKLKDSWFKKYIDESEVFVYSDLNKSILYKFKKLDKNDINNAKTELKSIINEYNKKLNDNTVCGSGGKYVLEKKEKKSDITISVKSNDIIKILPSIDVIDFDATYELRNGNQGAPEQVERLRANILKNTETAKTQINNSTGQIEENVDAMTFIMFGENLSGTINNKSFLGKIADTEKNFNETRKKIEEEITEVLSKKLTNSENGIGFVPTIQNVTAVLCASADAFLRILDEVHENAWNKRKDPIRISSVISNEKSFGVDNKGASVTDVLSTLSNYSPPTVYPWPHYFEKEYDKEGNEMFIEKYPGSTKSLSSTQGFKFDVWPEVKFIEDYVTAALIKQELAVDYDYNNELKVNKSVSFNTIEFPFENRPYTDLGEVPFFYEIYDRSYALSHYSMLAEQNKQTNELYSILGDFEINNIQESVKNSPTLTQKLKQYQFSNNTFLEYLRSISNNGQGLNWNILSRDGMSTSYLNELTNQSNSFGLYTIDLVREGSQTVEGNSNSIEKLENYLKSNSSKKLSILQTYPFTNLDFIKESLEDGSEIQSIENANDTSSVYSFMKQKKTLSSFTTEDDLLSKRPLVYFEWMKNTNNDSLNQLVNNEFTSQNYTGLKEFYQNRNLEKLYITESFVNYEQEYTDSGYQIGENQTTSLLNTPYFINSIINGVDGEKQGSTMSYTSLGYLLLNSLPFTSLYDKLKSFEDPTTKKENYHFSVLSKFSSIHRLPYLWILKYGSIWYRYKKYITTGDDILDDVWTGVDERKLFDPIGLSQTKEYSFSNKFTTENKISLKKQQYNPIDGTTTYNLNNGFYPKMIDSIYYMFTKKTIFETYTSDEIQVVVQDKNLNIEKTSSSSILKPKGYDLNNPNDILSIQNWSSYFDINGNSDFEKNENKLLIIPSCGYFMSNQLEGEFFDNNGLLKADILNDKSVYNGSVRTLWGVPNYGFYNTEKIVKPNPSQYLKLKNSIKKNSFGLSTKVDDYATIQDILSVFNKETLDLFETHFINFCQREENYKDIVNTYNPNKINFFSEDKQTYKINIFKLLKQFLIIDNPGYTEQQDENIKNITKKQTGSLGKLRDFIIDYDVIFKNGNSGNFNRLVFNSFSDKIKNHPMDKIEFDLYGTTTLNENTVKEFNLRIGDFGNNLEITNEFFEIFDIDFTDENVKRLDKIIKIYISKKYENENIAKNEFYGFVNEFLDTQNSFQDFILTHMFVNLNRKLPEVTIQESEKNISKLDGNVIKNELYYYFKSMNDRWVSGQDFKSITIFEDFLFLDKSNLPVGNDIIIDINKFLGLLNKDNNDKPLWGLISALCDQNRFNIMPSPCYLNFYGRNYRLKNADAIPFDAGDEIFGTYMKVDTRETRPKIICNYIGPVSEKVDAKNNENYVFGNDSFDLKKSQLNPLAKNQEGVSDYSNRNKVVGFTVDFGLRNQGMFKSVNINTSQHQETGAAYKVQEDMANQFKGQETTQQSTSMYNLYRSYSYKCDVSTFGNVMIQPTMYFHLKHVPMFHGTYQIIEVSHVITPGDFTTNFTGIRLPIFTNEKPDKLVSSINKDIVKKYRDSVKNLKSQEDQIDVDATETTPTSTTTQNSNISSEGVVQTTSNNCVNLTKYSDLPFVDGTETVSELTDSELFALIQSKTTIPILQGYLYTLAKYESQSAIFENNIFNIRTDITWGGNLSQTFTGQYCTKINNSYIPYAKLNSTEDGIDFMVARYTQIFQPEIFDTYLRNTIVDTNTRIATGIADIWLSSWAYNFISGLNGTELHNKVDEVLESDPPQTKLTYEYFISEYNSILL